MSMTNVESKFVALKCVFSLNQSTSVVPHAKKKTLLKVKHFRDIQMVSTPNYQARTLVNRRKRP